jgi:hypothetical protein
MGERANALNDRDLFLDPATEERDRQRASGGAAQSEPEVIAEEIELTRGEMTETIDAIQERLDPERLADQAVGAATVATEQARDAAKEVVSHAIDEAKLAVRELAGQAKDVVRDSTVGKVEGMAAQSRSAAEGMKMDLTSLIRQNPIPAALAGIGIAWLWMQRSPAPGERHAYDSPGYGRTDGSRGGALASAGQMVSQAQQTAGHMIGHAQGSAGELFGQAQGSAGHLLHQAQGTAGEVQSTATSAVRGMSADPLAIGTVGAVLGAVAALLIPETEQEHQLMGDAKAQVVERVQTAAGETVEKVQRVAAEVGQTAMREAKSQGVVPESGGSA